MRLGSEASRMLVVAIGVALLLISPAGTPWASGASTSFVERARELLASRDYREAELACRAALEELSNADGADTALEAELLDILAESLWRSGRSSARAK